MIFIKRSLVIIAFISTLLIGPKYGIAQANTEKKGNDKTSLSPAQERALQLLDDVDTLTKSAFWPHIKSSLFFANIRKNILYPGKINQGKNTNFCSYASLTHLLIRYQPDHYTRMILSLYKTGKTVLYSARVLEPSRKVREAAGTLRNNGELNILHADQLWFLTMADGFKGYLNLFNHKYRVGDENNFWAATNFSKFVKMLREFGGYKVHAIGSDLMRPWKNKENLYQYLTNQLDTGLVMIYINGKLMYPHKFNPFTIPVPTHFVVLYELNKKEDMIDIKYWDYGLKTEQLITTKRLKKSIYGIFSITEK